MNLMSLKTPYKKQNPIAKDLRTSKYRQRKVRDKTLYDRKRDAWTPTQGLLKMLETMKPEKNLLKNEEV